MVVLDTCAIIEISKNKPAVSNKTLKQIESGAYILSVSFAELACKIKLNKLELDISLSDLYLEFASVSVIEIVKIGVEEWFDAIALDWKQNKDPADRLITAFAMSKQIPIVTSDNQIKKIYNNILW